MYPILFRIGSHTISAYTVALAVGMVAGIWAAYSAAKTRLSDPGAVLDAGFWGLAGGILGGRAGYVAANWAYYGAHIDKAFAPWEGGLSWHGALIGGSAAVALWLTARGRHGPPVPDWRDLLDAIAPGLALGSAFGWLGCLLAGSAYGAEASGYGPPLSWLTIDLPDIYGVEGIRFATQPLMIAWCLLLWLVLWRSYRQLPRGLTLALYVLLYAVADLGVAFLRGDGAWRWGLWLSQWVDVSEVCVAIGLGLYAWTRRDSRENDAEATADNAALVPRGTERSDP